MITVVVVEENKSTRLLMGLRELLEQLTPAAVVGGQHCLLPDEPPGILLYQGQDGCRVDSARTIAVLGCDLTRCPQLVLPAGTRLLLSGQNPVHTQFAGQSRLTPLDCGLSLRDSLTLSSHTDSEAVVTLQRTVEDLWGRTVEPRDLPLTLEEERAAQLLLYFGGICLLTGLASRTETLKF